MTNTLEHNFDPDAHFIVVRGKQDGRHYHVDISQLDMLMEGIGASSRAVEPTTAPTGMSTDVQSAIEAMIQVIEAQGRRIEELENIAASSDGRIGILENAIIELSESAQRKLTEASP